VHRVLRFVRVSVVRCIPHVRHPLDRVPSVSVPGFRLQGRFVRAAVRVHLLAGPGSATFRVA